MCAQSKNLFDFPLPKMRVWANIMAWLLIIVSCIMRAHKSGEAIAQTQQEMTFNGACHYWIYAHL